MQPYFEHASDHPGSLRPITRAAVLLLVVMTLLAHGAHPARADDNYTDITGQRLKVIFTLPDKDSGQMTDENTAALINQSQPLPQSTKDSLAPLIGLALAPLSPTFDQMWSQTKDQNGKTMLDRSCDQAKNEIVTAVTNEFNSSSYTAYNVTCNFPSTGTLRAEVVGTNPELILSYWLPNDSIDFQVTTPYTGSCLFCLSDPHYTVTFDAELEIVADIPASPCDFSPQAEVLTHNGNVNADNAAADIGDFIGMVSNFFTDQPLNIFQSAEGQLSSGMQAISLGTLGAGFDQMSQACNAARGLGFTQFTASVDAINGLTLRLTHPLDNAPAPVNDATAHGPSLFSPTIAPSQSQQVNAGGQIAISGNYFPQDSAISLRVDWNDTTSGQITESDVDWGLQNGQIQHAIKPRTAYDNQNFFEADSLQANTGYQFRVRDCDLVTCSSWSAFQPVKTEAQGSNKVLFWLDNDSATQIGEATAGTGGTFSTNVSIPAAIPPGKHTLHAQVETPNGQQASTAITVLGANQSLQPEIAVVDSETNTLLQPGARIVAFEGFTLHGDGFGAGQSVTITLDSLSGQVIGTTQTGFDGTFQTQFAMPLVQNGGYGNHTLVAAATSNGQTVQATVAVYVDAPLR